MMKTIKLKKDKSNFDFKRVDATLNINEQISPLVEKVLVISEFSGECHEFKFSELTKTGVVIFSPVMKGNPVKILKSKELDDVEFATLKTILLQKYDEMFEYSDDRNYVKDQRHIKECLVKLELLKK